MLCHHLEVDSVPPFFSLAPADSDGPLYLPYKTLVSTISSMAFSEGEAQQLIEILTERAGIVQDTWHTVGLWATSWPPTAAASASVKPLQGKLQVFGWAGGPIDPTIQFWRLKLHWKSCQSALDGFCLWSKRVGLEMVVPTHVPPHFAGHAEG